MDASMSLEGHDTVILRGPVVWEDERGQRWVEPFLVRVHVRPEHVTYQLRFGRISTGLSASAWPGRQRDAFAPVDDEDWLHRFSGEW